MYKYTFADIIMDPTDPRLKDTIGKECYFADCPKGVLNLANNTSDTFRLRSIDIDGEYPFVDDEHGYEWAVIIIKKEEHKPKYVPFQNEREFFNAYQSAESRLTGENYFLSSHGIWLKIKDEYPLLYMVTEVLCYGVCVSGDMKTSEESEDEYLTYNDDTSWEELLKRYTFLDGSPCGRLVEEEQE